MVLIIVNSVMLQHIVWVIFDGHTDMLISNTSHISHHEAEMRGIKVTYGLQVQAHRRNKTNKKDRGALQSTTYSCNRKCHQDPAK
jgi:hypothetical protein